MSLMSRSSGCPGPGLQGQATPKWTHSSNKHPTGRLEELPFRVRLQPHPLPVLPSRPCSPTLPSSRDSSTLKPLTSCDNLRSLPGQPAPWEMPSPHPMLPLAHVCPLTSSAFRVCAGLLWPCGWWWPPLGGSSPHPTSAPPLPQQTQEKEQSPPFSSSLPTWHLSPTLGVPMAPQGLLSRCQLRFSRPSELAGQIPLQALLSTSRIKNMALRV